MMKLIPQTMPIQIGCTTTLTPAFDTPSNRRIIDQQNYAQQQETIDSTFKLNEDASEIICFVLNGGPKWGFRIKQLNDNRVIISKVNKAAPAEKCGLKVNDEILSVNNVPIVGNEPCSLLLNDYNDLTKTLITGAGDKITNNEQGAGDNNNNNSKKETTTIEGAQLLAAAAGVVSGAAQKQVELSKLDFTYQLIKHSSLSNKLMLTVKRFLNPAFARASVAASNISLANMSPNSFRKTINDQLTTSQQLQTRSNVANISSIRSGTMRERHDHDLIKSISNQLNNSNNAASGTKSSGSHYGYKCCECYCDNEGKFIYSINLSCVLFT